MIRMIKNIKVVAAAIAVLLAIGAICRPALAVRVRDVARLRGEMPQEIMGYGLVVGLPGTGDGGDHIPAIQALRTMLVKHENRTTLDRDLANVNTVALVAVTVTLPAKGFNEGDKLDVQIAAIGKPKSLAGGRLIWCPLINPMERPAAPEEQAVRGIAQTIYAVASGNLIVDDKQAPTRAIIKDGATVIHPWFPKVVNEGYIFLHLKPAVASNELSSAMADLINQEVRTQTEGKDIATAMDATTIAIRIPDAEAKNPTSFIAWVNSLPLPNLPGPAKVVIDTKTKTMIFTDEVELAPTTIDMKNGMTVTIGGTSSAAAAPVNGNNAGGAGGVVALDPAKSGSATLRDLETAFNSMRMSPDERIAIVRALYNAGALKCDMQIE
jgi:flagellar P-ring protein precursor FlgI